MAVKIFDRETLLDLIVNGVPLFIVLFFVLLFAVFNPFGMDPLASGLQFAILLASFGGLAVLTYLSAKAISGSEKRQAVYPPGQTDVPETDELDDH